ncbi:heme biosynthesis HemY N-terminal domain-containing protein [Kangiella sp. TOML190]|uniref:heme biosynthesis HemY N-terminal domain-containing protein n=1 Tax=Kangiella sp. TOML190 TaxID=2931351 RepID=UPI00203DD18C|nr:heme biosynthesis HemY N-terminal domain-containing protein [Kangiella sp. TOML190]
MKLRWYVIIGLFIGLLSVPFIRNIKGSTYILFDKTAIEFQNYFAVTVLMVAFLLIWFGWLLIRYLLKGTDKTLGWFGGRKGSKARQQTIDGMIALSEGHWQTAENLLAKSAVTNDTKLINYLGAARAAQKQSDVNKRDHFLKLAVQSEPDAQMAVGLTQVELQIENSEYESALAGLSHLRSINPNHPFVLTLLKTVYTKVADWKSLIELLPKLKKHRVLDEPEFAEFEHDVWQQRLLRAADKGLDKIESLWQQMPKSLTKDSQLNSIYCRSLHRYQQDELSESQIRQTLKRDWNNELVALYGQLENQDTGKQLATAEQWLKSHPNDTVLLNTLGKLSLNHQIWGKAKNYLEQSLAIKPSSEAYFYLAKAFEHLGHPINAQEAYQKGLALQVLTPP